LPESMGNLVGLRELELDKTTIGDLKVAAAISRLKSNGCEVYLK